MVCKIVSTELLGKLWLIFLSHKYQNKYLYSVYFFMHSFGILLPCTEEQLNCFLFLSIIFNFLWFSFFTVV